MLLIVHWCRFCYESVHVHHALLLVVCVSCCKSRHHVSSPRCCTMLLRSVSFVLLRKMSPNVFLPILKRTVCNLDSGPRSSPLKIKLICIIIEIKCGLFFFTKIWIVIDRQITPQARERKRAMQLNYYTIVLLDHIDLIRHIAFVGEGWFGDCMLSIEQFCCFLVLYCCIRFCCCILRHVL